MDYETIENEVKKVLSAKRFNHSQEVVNRAIELAKIYGLDEEIVKKVAIAHDIAKEMTIEDSFKYAEENNIEFDEIEKKEPSLLHSKIGADIAKKKFKFTSEMSDAILYHTTGNVKMDKLAKVIYIADKTEKNRTYIDLEKAKEISNKNLDEGILYISGIAIKYNIDKGALIHTDTIDLINSIILKKLGE